MREGDDFVAVVGCACRRASINRPPTPNQEEDEDEERKEVPLSEIINLKVLTVPIAPAEIVQEICGRVSASVLFLAWD
jgi:hypothetical protein